MAETGDYYSPGGLQRLLPGDLRAAYSYGVTSCANMENEPCFSIEDERVTASTVTLLSYFDITHNRDPWTFIEASDLRRLHVFAVHSACLRRTSRACTYPV